MRNLLYLILLAGATCLVGCEGLAVWTQGRYFHNEISDTAAFKDISTIGVYVFCDGETTEERSHISGLGLGDWPSSEVVPGATFSADTANAGPTLELANSIAKELSERGYNAKAVNDMTHNKEVKLEECLSHAKSNNYDGAFVVYYTGYSGSNSMNSLARALLGGSSTVTNTPTSFLYIPHGGFFQVSSGKQLWKNSYYGLVQNAHAINLSGEPFVIVGGGAATENNEATYIAAAPKVAKQLLDPPHFPETAKPFPGHGERKHRM